MSVDILSEEERWELRVIWQRYTDRHEHDASLAGEANRWQLSFWRDWCWRYRLVQISEGRYG